MRECNACEWIEGVEVKAFCSGCGNCPDCCVCHICPDCGGQERMNRAKGRCEWCLAEVADAPHGRCEWCTGAKAKDGTCNCNPVPVGEGR